MRLIYWYLRIALFLGFEAHVYNLSSRWGSTTTRVPRRSNAAWEIQKDLVKCGFHKCQFCGWATRELDEHLKTDGWCYGQSIGNPSVPWDQEPDPQLAYEKMPDCLR